MGKNLYIAEKPSVAKEFAKALKVEGSAGNGYMETGGIIVTWCVGHLVTMSYPEAYGEEYRRWSFDTIPFIPETYKYEVIESARRQFQIVNRLLNREDVSTIYVCTDSGREGEYIYRLVEQEAGVKGKQRRRVWIDSQTEEEILRGIREAKDLSAYDNLSNAAYLRAQEDYLMGINFSRALTLKYGNALKSYLKRDKGVISVGRVMTCVLGMVVDREREIRSFVKTPFYRVIGNFLYKGKLITAEWKATEGSAFYGSPLLYKENGFRKKEDAQKLIDSLSIEPAAPIVESIQRKKEKKNPPLLFNLAELQNTCAKLFKISPDETLAIAQELYEKKLVTYPRTDARVLSTAVAKEIHKNISGLQKFSLVTEYASQIIREGKYKGISSTRYVDDRQITDHYAIIPTGQGLANLKSLTPLKKKVYEVIVRRFLSIFYPPAVYQKISLCIRVKSEQFFTSFKVLLEEGYLPVTVYSFSARKNGVIEEQPGVGNKERPEILQKDSPEKKEPDSKITDTDQAEQEIDGDTDFQEILKLLKKGTLLELSSYEIREGETSPPKRYNSGSIILTMENAGQFIEDEELRAQIKGSGIGTSATRAEILKKLVNIEYLALNAKTQILTPTLLGEMVYDVVSLSIRPLLDPALTASWEKGLSMVAGGTITAEEYRHKLEDFVTRRTNIVKQLSNQSILYQCFQTARQYYDAV